jgi:hypothetical protein
MAKVTLSFELWTDGKVAPTAIYLPIDELPGSDEGAE